MWLMSYITDKALWWVNSIAELSDAWDIDLHIVTVWEIYLVAFIPKIIQDRALLSLKRF